MNESLEQLVTPEEALTFIRSEEFAIGTKLAQEIAQNPGVPGVSEARELLEALTLATDIAERMVQAD